MKKLTTKMISFILVVAMMFTTNVTAFASQQVIYDDTISVEQVQIAEEIYTNLTPEARAIFEQTISSDQELLEFHQTYIDSDFQPSPMTRSVSATASVANQLALLGLPSAVTYSLNAMAASMVAAIADGPLPIGDILLAASVTAVAATVALNWDVVEPLWDDIVDIFTNAFSDSVSSVISAFDSLFSDAEAQAEEESDDRIDDVIQGKEKIKDSSSDIYEGEGGYSQAENDFDDLVEGETKTYPNGTKVGKLPDGTNVNLRNQSSDGRPTIEIQRNRYIKIRYN